MFPRLAGSVGGSIENRTTAFGTSLAASVSDWMKLRLLS